MQSPKLYFLFSTFFFLMGSSAMSDVPVNYDCHLDLSVNSDASGVQEFHAQKKWSTDTELWLSIPDPTGGKNGTTARVMWNGNRGKILLWVDGSFTDAVIQTLSPELSLTGGSYLPGHMEMKSIAELVCQKGTL